jgi:hypothetical protein
MKPTITFNKDTLNINLVLSVDDLMNAPLASSNRRGRPPSLSPEDQRLFLILMQVGASQDDICTALKISRCSYFKYKKAIKAMEPIG